MPQLDRRLLAIAAAAAVLLLFVGFGIGRLTAGDSEPVATDTTTNEAAVPQAAASTDQDQDAELSDAPDEGTSEASSTTTVASIEGDASAVLPPTVEAPEGGIPEYGTEVEQEWFLIGVAGAGVTGTSRDDLLATGYHVCYTLERLQAQDRSPSYAVRVIWNESLAELESEDLAAFAAVYQAAPLYLCPDSVEYGIEVAYWLGY